MQKFTYVNIIQFYVGLGHTLWGTPLSIEMFELYLSSIFYYKFILLFKKIKIKVKKKLYFYFLGSKYVEMLDSPKRYLTSKTNVKIKYFIIFNDN